MRPAVSHGRRLAEVHPFLLLDGNSLAYRAYFALPEELRTSSGQQTNAVFGFTSMLLNVVRDFRPEGLAVAFDLPEPTFRHEISPTYKAHREKAPDPLRQQLDLVREVVRSLGVAELEAPGYEADDVIATVATRLASEGLDVVVVTGDRDALQIVRDPHVKVLYNRRGVSDYVLFDEKAVEQKFGIPPARYPFFAALRGDVSDNIPGVAGVGEKTAAKLAASYDGPEELFAALDQLPPALRKKLEGSEEQVLANLRLTTLVRDVPLDVSPEDLRLRELDPTRVRRLFDFLEFHSLVGRLEEAFGSRFAPAGTGHELVVDYQLLGVGDLPWFLEQLDACDTLAIGAAWEADEVDVPAALAFVGVRGDDAGEAPQVRVLPADSLRDSSTFLRVAQALAKARGIVAWDAKPLLKSVMSVVDLRNLVMDVKVASYLLDPTKARYDLADTTREVLGCDIDGGRRGDESDGEALLRRAGFAAVAAARLRRPLLEKLTEQGMRRLHDEVETPLVRVLAKMEHVGIKVDVDRLRELDRDLAERTSRVLEEIWEAAGEKFNVGSTQQLREVLFDKLGLQPQKRTKTGWSTDAATLEKLRGAHPIVELILRWRELDKLRSTFAQGLLAEVRPDGRIHATFNQTVARTGRISSENPNLHNIPVRSAEGRVFREIFVPEEGRKLIVADYDQIELRCIAHLSRDPGLLDAFRSGKDVHVATAARVFGVPEEAVTKEMRERAKMVSYGLAYGMEAYGLGQRLGIPTGEAGEILEAYFRAFPKVREYMEGAVREARERGYTVTLLGRRRPVPELASPNRRIREAGERQAMNSGIQGLAADIFKIALVAIDEAFDQFGGAATVVLQVHDEVIAEVDAGLADSAAEVVRGCMERAFELDVPLAVDVGIGGSWAEAKS
ncbi:MAG: DNA polymerase I [Acidimicrobiales bacterium]|nr:MAG: DNA polymerase I [Acidimicrobiales bacterium]